VRDCPATGGRPGYLCGTVAVGAACLRVRGSGAAAAPATGGLPPIGRGQAAAPESPGSPAAGPQLPAANLTLPDELPQRIAIVHGIGQGRNGLARRGAPLKPWRNLSQIKITPVCPQGLVTQLVTYPYIRGHTREPGMASDLGRGGRI